MRRRVFNLFWILSFALATSLSVNSIDIKCEFVYDEWVTLGSVYTCHVRDLVIKTPNETVTNIIGAHKDGKVNKDVIKINIANQECEFLPKGFEKFFPNVEGLRVAQSGLVNLNQSDLSVFPKLRSCDMFHNLLTNLDGDLFEKNSKVEYLYFGDNQIHSIGHNILKPLMKLQKAIFQGNQCIDKNAETHRDVYDLQIAFHNLCSSSFAYHHHIRYHDSDPMFHVDDTESNYNWEEQFDEEMKKLFREHEKFEAKQNQLLEKEEKIVDGLTKVNDDSSHSGTFWTFVLIGLLLMIPGVFLISKRVAQRRQMLNCDRIKILTSFNEVENV